MACKNVETVVENIYLHPQQKYFESLLHSFYSDVLPKLFNLKSPQLVESTKKYMEQILESENKKSKKEPFSLNDYKNEACMCAYMHQYCVYYSSIATGLFRNMLNEKPDIKENLLSRKEIRICCLGGGSGTEAVGIGLAIQHELENEEHDVDLCVSIIDGCNSWRRVIHKVVKAANKRTEKVNWKAEFIESNILDPLSSEVTKKIRNADCITMVNFSSSVFTQRAVKKQVIRERFEEILKLIKPEAMIFYLDSSDDHYSKEIENITAKFRNLLKVYRQQECFGRQKLLENTSFYDETLKEYYLKDYPSVTAAVWTKYAPPKARTDNAKSYAPRPPVFLPKREVPFTDRRLLLLLKDHPVSKFIDKRSEQVKREHKYRDAARSSSSQKSRYAVDGYD